MERYGDIDRDSGVVAYENGSDYIRVQFSDGSIYLYTNRSAGQKHIKEMKTLASRGDGLNAYINNHARKSYERKER
ncbi:hypothetical protein KFV02_04465 [Desulfohalobiaceae bacterium Ax17]|uniref:hypothetical protein n=1 Tax=Desulfovulcanus ferrireducens TaxID=2831190 RepID=UPI00207BA763|nr:hypothetical protein [Desulfovulcanus ferrireducens]MBT8763181.1 hypothetical protein [Desulfovulcanus ferrireducens]